MIFTRFLEHFNEVSRTHIINVLEHSTENVLAVGNDARRNSLNFDRGHDCMSVDVLLYLNERYYHL